MIIVDEKELRRYYQAEYEKAVAKAKEDARKQEKINERDNVISKYGKIFHPDNLDNLTKEDFKNFCKIEHNRHWTNDRVSGWDSEKKGGTIEQVRNGLKILLDESKPLAERINQIDDEQNMMPGIGPAVYTSILYVVYPEKYPPVNRMVILALDRLGKYSERDYDRKKKSESIPAIQEIVKQYAEEFKLNFWATDWIWYHMINGINDVDNVSPLLKFLKEDEIMMFRPYQPIVLKMLLEATGSSSISTIKQAAITILQQNGTPMHYKEITEKALEQNLMESEGRTPELSLLRDMSEDIRLNGKNAIFEKINDGVYGLNDYSSKSESSVTVKEIREKIAQLSFGTDSDSCINSVKGTLERRGLVDFTGSAASDTATLKEGVVNTDEIQECLKICGHIMANWHVRNLMKDENQCWFIQAGSDGENFEKFRKGGYAAVDYLDEETRTFANFDLSGMTKEEIEAKTDGKKGTELSNISQIKQADVIAVVNGNKSVEEFSIATSDYYFLDSDTERDKHRANVEYLNFGTTEIGKGKQPAIVKNTEKIKNFLLGEKEPRYFLLRHKPDGPYDDDTGKKYHFSKTVPNYKKLLKYGTGLKAIWDHTQDKGTYYFWGYGTVKEIETLKENEEWNLIFDNFTFFDKEEDSIELNERFLKRGSESIQQKIKYLEDNSKKTGFNYQHSPRPITKKIYEEITGDRSTMSSSLQSSDTLTEGKYIDALKWIPNLILYGPPGTGKTYHAKKIAKEFTLNQSNRDFDYILPAALKQTSSVEQMSDDEYRDFIINAIKTISEQNDYGFTEIKTHSQYSLEKDAHKIHIDIHYSASNTQDPVDSYVGISQANIDFLKQVPEDNRFILIVNHSKKNFVVLPYSIEQKQKTEFSNSSQGNWDPTGVNAHSFHIKIDNDSAEFKRSGYDCKNFVRNINMIFSNELIHNVTFHPSFSYEDFIEGFRPDVNPSTSSQYVLEDGIFKTVCNIAKTNHKKKIVVIIDEINRGNIPKIFGELISLIEKDKRGPNNPLKLVYSKKNFFVPKNLYIIGTMNTADKSLVQMDEALRRRFAFEELMPQPDLLDERYQELQVPKSDADTYKDILVKLNDKITNSDEKKRQYRDKQIGHSYFWNIENDNHLRLVIKYQIIPLLQDYFYDDYAEIKGILGDEIITKENRQSDLLDKGNEAKLKDALLKALNPSKNTEQEKSTKDTEKEEDDNDE